MQAKKLAQMIIDLLREQNQLDALPQIITELSHANQSNQAVLVTSAHKLSSDSRANLEELLETRLGYKPQVRYQVKPELIAGIQVQINDQLVDASIKQKLEQVFKKIH